MNNKILISYFVILLGIYRIIIICESRKPCWLSGLNVRFTNHEGTKTEHVYCMIASTAVFTMPDSQYFASISAATTFWKTMQGGYRLPEIKSEPFM